MSNNTFVKEIETDYEKLSKMSVEIDVRKDNKRVQYITKSLIETIKAKNLRSLTACQIGYFVRMFAINFNGTVKVFINPGITNCTEQGFARETCSSLPDKKFIVPRYGKCDVMYMTPRGVPEFRTFTGMAAYVYQHCLDHIEGILVSDFGLEIEEDFEQASDEDKMAILKQYAETIAMKAEEAKLEVENDPDAKKLDDAVKFMAAKRAGEVEIEGTVTVDKDGNVISETKNEPQIKVVE